MAANLAKHHLGKAHELDAQEAAMDAREAAIAKEAASKPPLSRPLASLLGKAIVVTGATSGLGRCWWRCFRLFFFFVLVVLWRRRLLLLGHEGLPRVLEEERGR